MIKSGYDHALPVRMTERGAIASTANTSADVRASERGGRAWEKLQRLEPLRGRGEAKLSPMIILVTMQSLPPPAANAIFRRMAELDVRIPAEVKGGRFPFELATTWRHTRLDGTDFPDPLPAVNR